MRIYAFSAYHFHSTAKATPQTTVSASASAIARNHSFHTKPRTNIPFLFRTNHSIKKAPDDVKVSAGAILRNVTPPGSRYRGSSVKPHS